MVNLQTIKNMDLSEIYANRVKKSPVTQLSVGSHQPFIQNRDSTINKLEKNVFAKMKEIVGEDNSNNSSKVSQNTVNSVSFSDALKELSQMVKNQVQ
jgi:hypothetical protein